jgi:ribosome-associated toxin RatA of RatAB toxin-antitoxin module
MAEQATQRITIEASPERCYDVVVDFERYPEWARDVKDVVVTSRDEGGRPVEVEFRAAAFGRSTRYTLRYDHSLAPGELSWKLVQGDIMRACDGAYDFAPTGSGGTDVTYHLAIELVVPLPGFVKRRAEVRILNTVKELKSRVEGQAQPALP